MGGSHRLTLGAAKAAHIGVEPAGRFEAQLLPSLVGQTSDVILAYAVAGHQQAHNWFGKEFVERNLAECRRVRADRAPRHTGTTLLRAARSM